MLGLASFVNVRLHFSFSFRCWKTADGEYITSFCFCLSSSELIQIFPQLVLIGARALRNLIEVMHVYTLSSISIYSVLVKFVNNS